MLMKNFTLYTPEKVAFPGALYLKDEEGNDWYESQQKFDATTLKIIFNSSGVIISKTYDVSGLWPIDNSVAEIPEIEVPKDLDINGGWVFDGKKIIKRKYTSAELMEQAQAKRDSLMAVATAAIAPLQDAVDIDEATDAEISLLKEWKKYRVELNRLDLSTAPNIDWPATPA
ncbi:tail fiber assembly protein [Enterobacteriaceae bacterium ML5]|nr:tail fiber assembly protein [Enterobacteriaceae bacterium ML5]